VVRAEGVEPPQAFRPYGFSTNYGFRRPRLTKWGRRLVCGLDYPFTLASGLRCCPSSLYASPEQLFPGLGSGLPYGKVSPNLSSSASTVSRRALNQLSPLRLPFRHAPCGATYNRTPRSFKGLLRAPVVIRCCCIRDGRDE